MDHDQAIAKLREIIEDFSAFLRKHGPPTEADTRAQFVSRVLHDVLGWPTTSIRRETAAHAGWVDYELTTTRPIAVIEAKRTGQTWITPNTLIRKRYTLSGLLKTIKSS